MTVGPGSIADVLLVATAAPVAAAATYLAALALLARRSRIGSMGGHGTTFDILVPAHDEQDGVQATVRNLLSLEYPRPLFRVIVIADNCSDATAARARDAGALVQVRTDPLQRGKGHALACGFDSSLASAFAKAVVVVDADTLVSPNLLTAFAARIERGAQAIQAEYGVRNPTASWRTRLMVVAFTLFHTVRSLARERLGLSSGLRGNGMCFTSALLRRVPHRAASVVEDVEFGIDLGLHGTRVVFAPEATVRGEMPATAATARSQRERWERGRWVLMRQYVPALLRASLARRDPVPLDLAIDLMVPPLTALALATSIGLVSATVAFALGYAGAAGVVAWGWAFVGLLVYVARGCTLSGVGPRVVLDLLWAPAYAAWKVSLVFATRLRRPTEWVRTARTSDP